MPQGGDSTQIRPAPSPRGRRHFASCWPLFTVAARSSASLLGETGLGFRMISRSLLLLLLLGVGVAGEWREETEHPTTRGLPLSRTPLGSVGRAAAGLDRPASPAFPAQATQEQPGKKGTEAPPAGEGWRRMSKAGRERGSREGRGAEGREASLRWVGRSRVPASQGSDSAEFLPLSLCWNFPALRAEFSSLSRDWLSLGRR